MADTLDYNIDEEIDKDLNIDLKKILLTVWNRKKLVFLVFCVTICFFVLITLFGTKKYTVTADLYINKGNTTHMADVNPYILEDSTGSILSMSSTNLLANEMELIKSEPVINNVIAENDIRYKKILGIFPNKKEGELISTDSFLKKGKNPKFENIKGTNVITVKYVAKKPELAYNVVSSIITNYIKLQKELQADKSKFDTMVLEKEYQTAQQQLNDKLNKSEGMSGQGDKMAALAAFSSGSTNASTIIRSQMIQGEKNKIDITKEAKKVTELSAKLQWAKLVEEMSASSKVIVLREPHKLRDFEYSSPKPLINFLISIVYGLIFSAIAVLIAEIKDKKLTWSMLSGKIINSIDDIELKKNLLINKDKKVSIIAFETINEDVLSKLRNFQNITVVNAEFTANLIDRIKFSDQIMTFAKIGETDAELYKQIKSVIENLNKEILFEILL